ncbi:hypothetical protein SHIRM173S_03311 [Streptomyces hirsutus]
MGAARQASASSSTPRRAGERVVSGLLTGRAFRFFTAGTATETGSGTDSGTGSTGLCTIGPSVREDMGVTIADVATRAGVSKTTVSRVLNGKGEINENTVLKGL